MPMSGHYLRGRAYDRLNQRVRWCAGAICYAVIDEMAQCRATTGQLVSMRPIIDETDRCINAMLLLGRAQWMQKQRGTNEAP